MENSKPASHQPTLRQIAAEAGVSAMTVSRVLRGKDKLAPESHDKVLKIASKMGYVRNPLAGALMSVIRRSGGAKFRGSLAVLDIESPERREVAGYCYHRELARGAVAAAEMLGFTADVIKIGPEPVSSKRINGILKARGVYGVLLLPLSTSMDLAGIEWNRFSAIYADLFIENPGLHCICPDHYRGMMTALERLRGLGYRRLGLVMHSKHDLRLLHRWEAAFRAFLAHHPEMEWVSPLLAHPNDHDQFVKWFRASKCDVVLGRSPQVPEWMAEQGARVPETHGFFGLNVRNFAIPCAGLELQPDRIGGRAMDLLIGMALRNECGVPEEPMTVTMPVKWVDGPTVRGQATDDCSPKGPMAGYR